MHRRPEYKQIRRGKKYKDNLMETSTKRESLAENMMRACFISNDYSKLVSQQKKADGECQPDFNDDTKFPLTVGIRVWWSVVKVKSRLD